MEEKKYCQSYYDLMKSFDEIADIDMQNLNPQEKNEIKNRIEELLKKMSNYSAYIVIDNHPCY